MFDTIRIENKTFIPNNIWLAVYPFKLPDNKRFNIFRYATDKDIWNGEPLPDRFLNLVKDLYEQLPSISCIIFENGRIIIQHTGAFSDKEIIEVAEEIIELFLKKELNFESMFSCFKDNIN